MKKIIALRGKNNSGKSATIRLLYDLLLEHGYKKISRYETESVDFRAVLKKKDTLIGITSAGATYDLLHSDLESLLDSGCTLCVCSCRTYDRNEEGTNAAVESFRNCQKQFIDKTIAPNAARQDQFNRIDSKTLFNTIESLAKK